MDTKAKKDRCWDRIQQVLQEEEMLMSITYETKIDPKSIQITLRTRDEADKA